MFVIGSHSTATSSSTVIAVDLGTGEVVWRSTIDGVDSTNFAIVAAPDDPEYLWVRGQNRSKSHSSNVVVGDVIVVHKLMSRTGNRVSEWPVLTTQASRNPPNASGMEVSFGQLMLITSSGDLLYASSVDGSILNSSDLGMDSGWDHMHVPVLSHHTWYVFCGHDVVTYDNATGAMITQHSVNDNVLCVAVHEESGTIVFADVHNIYTALGASGVSTLAALPRPYPNHGTFNLVSTCVGGRFLSGTSSSPHHFTVHLSFRGDHVGQVVSMDYQTGDVVAQLAANLNPVGPVAYDVLTNTISVASTAGMPLQAFLLNNDANASTTVLPSYGIQVGTTNPTQFALAYNATDGGMYYIASMSLWHISSVGVASNLVNYSYIGSDIQPVVLGANVFIFNQAMGTIHVYDANTQTLQEMQGCDNFDASMQPYDYASQVVVVFCTDASTAGFMVNVSLPLLQAISIPASDDRIASGALMFMDHNGATILAITVGTNTVEGFAANDTMNNNNNALWSVNPDTNDVYSVRSPLVLYEDYAYFVASYAEQIAYASYVWRVSCGGNASRIAHLANQMPRSTLPMSLIIESSSLGRLMMYVIGNQNISAFSFNDASNVWDHVYHYESNTTIQSLRQGSPRLLDSDYLYYYTNDRTFTAFDVRAAHVAWTYPVYYQLVDVAVMSDGTSVYFSDDVYIVSVNTKTFALSSISSFLSNKNFGYTIVPSNSSNEPTTTTTTVLGVQQFGSVFSVQVPI